MHKGEPVGSPTRALPIGTPQVPDTLPCRQAHNEAAMGEAARRDPIVLVQQHFEHKKIVCKPSCPMVDMALVDGCLWGRQSNMSPVDGVGLGFALEVVTLPPLIGRVQGVREKQSPTPNSDDADGGLARVAMVQEDCTSSWARVARYAQPPGLPDLNDPARQLPEHLVARRSS